VATASQRQTRTQPSVRAKGPAFGTVTVPTTPVSVAGSTAPVSLWTETAHDPPIAAVLAGRRSQVPPGSPDGVEIV